jgi:hypothetical protein
MLIIPPSDEAQRRNWVHDFHKIAKKEKKQ